MGEKEIVRSFEQQDTLSFPRSPENNVQPVPKRIMYIDLNNPNVANSAKNQKVRGECVSLLRFIRSHPFLVAGMAISLLLLFLSFHSLANSLAQHSSLNIFPAHLAVGGGIGFMFLYYAVMINNMRRKAQIKDDTAELIKATSELLSKIDTEAEESKNNLVKQINRQFIEIENEGKERLENLEKDLSETKKELLHYRT